MKSILLLIIFALANLLAGAERKVNSEVFDAVIREVSKFHYDGNFRQKYAQTIKKFRQKALQAKNNDELGKKINEFFRQIPDSHLGIMAPPDKKAGNTVLLQNDITLLESGGKVLVYEVTGNSGAAKILKKGDEILSLNDFSPDPNARIGMAVQLKNKLAVGVLHEKNHIVFIRNGKKMSGSFVNLKLKKMPPLFKLGEMPPLPEFYSSKMLDSQTGYIRFDIFTPASLLKLRQDVRTKFKNTPKLVIDMRSNMGGLIMLGVNSASFLCGKRVDFGTMTIDKQQLTSKSYPQKDRYKGKIFILIGRNSYSTAEIFAQSMKEAGQAVLIGEKTSGMCLPSVALPLPHGFTLQTVVGDYVSSKNYRIEGKGVIPEKIIKLDSKNLALGRDAQIEFIKSL